MRWLSILVTSAFVFTGVTIAGQLVESRSLVPCMANSNFSAKYFRVVFTPGNGTITYRVDGESKVSDHVKFDLSVVGYGYTILRKVIDPCSGNDLKGLCPMTSGKMSNMKSNFILEPSLLKRIPGKLMRLGIETPWLIEQGVIYYIPDLDAKVRVWINSTETGKPLACVEARISNGQTVNHNALAWSFAAIAGLCLIGSGFMSGFGHFLTSAHISARALAVISYFQSQALIGMVAVPLPPIVRGWTQVFQWSMGIVPVKFHQKFATWHQRATGGVPSRLFHKLLTTSVHLQKRNSPGPSPSPNHSSSVPKPLIGMERVSFLAGIEISNMFFTGYTIFILILIVVALSIVVFKGICELLVRSHVMNPLRFGKFRNEWSLVFKGILLRFILIGCLPMIVLCCWELSRWDSGGQLILAAWMILCTLVLLAVSTVKVLKITRNSKLMHGGPDLNFYTNPVMLNKWGFLCGQYKATMTWFLIIALLHSLIKGLSIAVGQRHGQIQAISLFLFDLGFFVTGCLVNPYMDKTTDRFNISIASINCLNVLILLLISGVFGLPPLVVGVLGVFFFVANAVFACTIIIMTIYTMVRACLSRNPDGRYQFMFYDRESLVRSQVVLESTERELPSQMAMQRICTSGYSLGTDSFRSDVESCNESPGDSKLTLQPISPLETSLFEEWPVSTAGRSSPAWQT